MFLAEAVKEMDFIKDSIGRVRNRISNLMVVKGDIQVSSQFLLKELDDLYKKYQQYIVTIERAKSASFIQVNNNKLSIADAVAIKDVMLEKLHTMERVLSDAELINRRTDSILCLDLEEVYKNVESVRVDIKTLEGEIDYAMWQIEV